MQRNYWIQSQKFPNNGSSPDPPNAMPVMPLNVKTVDPRSRPYIGLPSISAVPVGDFVRTVWVSLKPADR